MYFCKIRGILHRLAELALSKFKLFTRLCEKRSNYFSIINEKRYFRRISDEFPTNICYIHFHKRKRNAFNLPDNWLDSTVVMKSRLTFRA